jgi:hypothetical protein
MIKGWAKSVAWAGTMKTGLQDMLQLLNLKEKGSLGHNTHKRTIWEGNIKTDLKKQGWEVVDYIGCTQSRAQLRGSDEVVNEFPCSIKG